MKLEEAKEKFVNAWGTLGSNWGINRTMAQVHALLLVSSNPMSAEDIMAELNISRGNANMTVRELINWGLVFRVNVITRKMVVIGKMFTTVRTYISITTKQCFVCQRNFSVFVWIETVSFDSNNAGCFNVTLSSVFLKATTISCYHFA